MKIVVDRNRCDGNGVCMGLAPDVFEVDDDLQLHILVEEPTAEQMPDVRQAVTSCPVLALSLVDGD
jgi:ferredoxin